MADDRQREVGHPRDNELKGDLGDAIAGTKIRGRRLDSVMAGKLSLAIFEF
jgi:hypothetical protein